MSQAQNYSEQTAESIDGEVRRIVVEQYARARKLVEGSLDILHSIAKALLEYETLDMRDIKTLMAGNSLTRSKPTTRIKTREQIEDERSRRNTAAAAGAGLLGGPLPEPGNA